MGRSTIEKLLEPVTDDDIAWFWSQVAQAAITRELADGDITSLREDYDL